MLRLNVKLESLELPKGASPELLREKLEDSEALRICKRLAFQKEFKKQGLQKNAGKQNKGKYQTFPEGLSSSESWIPYAP